MLAAIDGFPLSALATEKVQKKMSVAQGVGLKEADYPCVSEESVSRSESAPQRDAAANDYPAKGRKESAREPCHFIGFANKNKHHRCVTRCSRG